MKIGILSDTHDHKINIEAAIQILNKYSIQKLFHCGDVTSLAGLELICKPPFVLTFGNGDFMTGEMRDFILSTNPDNSVGYRYEGECFEKKIGMTHSHLKGVLDEMINSQIFDYVFFGHTHLRTDQKIGRTRVINPGSLGGLKKQTRSICILDLEKDEAKFEEIF
ncbi:MAG: metallophosphoesterase family protein [Anaerolineaceae bacterium]